MKKVLTTTIKSTPYILGVLLIVTVGVLVFLGYRITIVNGNSMLPTYQSGDIVISKTQDTYQVGDVIVYHPADLDCSRCNIVHRIVDVTEDGTGWVTQGDNNENIDLWYPTTEEIIGKEVMVLHWGNFTKLLFSPLLCADAAS